jgi:LacI family transcriptional regulator
MPRKCSGPEGRPANPSLPFSLLACPNPDCADFNRFGAGNLSVCERMGKAQAICRLYCHTCHTRFSERQGSLMEYTKLPAPTVVRVIKCLAHGCSVEATADICEVDARTVERLLERAGPRAEDFHRLQLERLEQPLEAVELDELHARASDEAEKKGRRLPRKDLLRLVASWVARGFTRPWRS